MGRNSPQPVFAGILEMIMKIHCPQCKAGYRIDAAKIPDQGAFLNCKKCGNRFQIKKPAAAADQPDLSDTASPEAPVAAENPETAVSEQDPRLAEIDEQITRHLEQGGEEECARFIVEQVSRFAEAREFTTAEKMRERLYNAAPMALNEIIRAGEIIEEAKQNAMDKKHLSLWKDLYDSLEPGEASEIYFALKKMSVKNGQYLFKQGEFDSRLYFIQDGRFEMTCFHPTEEKEVKLEELIAGDIANINPFFSFTICTYSLKSERDGMISYLEKDILTAWKENYAGIEPKLQNFCRDKDRFGTKMAEKGLNQRAHERVQTSAVAMVQLLDNAGKPVQKPFRIALFDISRGGLNFGMKLNKKEDAEVLLQHRMYLQTIYNEGSEKKKISFKGRVIAIHLQPFGESSIHLQFDQLLDESTVQAMGN